MKNPIFESLSPGAKFIFALFIIFVSFLFILFIGLFISIPIFGIDITNFKEHFDPSVAGNLNFMKFMQVLQSIAIFVIPPIVAAILFSKSYKKYLFLDKKPISLVILFSVLITIVVIPIINYTAALNSNLSLPASLAGLENSMKLAEEAAKQTTIAFLKAEGFGGLLFNLFMVALIPAIGEELLFRGLLLKIFKAWTKNIHVTIFITAFLFSFIHFQFYGFLPRFLLGALLGYLVYWSGSLWYSVIVHFINNAIGVLAYFLYFEKAEFEKMESLGANFNFTLVVSILFLAGLLYAFRNYFYTKKVTKAEIT